VGIQNDGTLIWLRGSTSGRRELGGGRHLIAEGGKFVVPGKPFTLWAWHPDRTAPPHVTFSATCQWLDFRVAPRFERIYVRSAFFDDGGKYRVDYIEVVIVSNGAHVVSSTRKRYEGRHHYQTPDGRLAAHEYGALLGPRIMITDMRTGKRRHVRRLGSLLGHQEGPFAPIGHKMIFIGDENSEGGLRCDSLISTTSDPLRKYSRTSEVCQHVKWASLVRE